MPCRHDQMLPVVCRILASLKFCSHNIKQINQSVIPRQIKKSTWWCIHTVVELEVKRLVRLNTSLIQHSNNITFRFYLFFRENAIQVL